MDNRHRLVGVVNRRGEEDYFVYPRLGYLIRYFVLSDHVGAVRSRAHVHALVLGIAAFTGSHSLWKFDS